MNISSVSLVLISFKTFAYQESYSWVPYCFAVLTASCSGSKLFFLSSFCSCWLIQILLYLDNLGMLNGVAEPLWRCLFALPEVALCLRGKDHTLPVGLCSMSWHRRWWQVTGQGQVKKGDRGQIETLTFHTDLESPESPWQVRSPIKVFYLSTSLKEMNALPGQWTGQGGIPAWNL